MSEAEAQPTHLQSPDTESEEIKGKENKTGNDNKEGKQ